MTTPPAMFHHFTDRVHPNGQGALDSDQFREVLDLIGVGRILPAQEYLERFCDGRLDADSTCLTFDDNLRCQFDVALPVMDDLGLTAFWFVYSSPLQGVVERLELYRFFRTVAFDTVEAFYRDFFVRALDSSSGPAVEAALRSFEPASWHPESAFYTDDDRRFRYLRDGVLADGGYDRIMESMLAARGFDVDRLVDTLWMDGSCWRDLVDRGHLIGLHWPSHPTAIADCPVAVQRDEYEQNSRAIARVTGTTPTTAAHPCGSYSLDTLDILESLGVELAFAVNGGVRYRRPHLEVQRIDSADLLAAVCQK